MKPIDVKDNTYIVFGKKVNDNDPKFNIGDHVRISKNFLLKVMLQIGLKKSLSLKRLNVLFHSHMLLMIIMVKKLLEHSMKNNSKR